MSKQNSECTCCTCEPCPKSMSCANEMSENQFKEFLPVPKGITKDKICLEVKKNSYKVCGKATLSCSDDETIIHSVEFERSFKKPIKDVELKEENGHPYVEGKFQ